MSSRNAPSYRKAREVKGMVNGEGPRGGQGLDINRRHRKGKGVEEVERTDCEVETGKTGRGEGKRCPRRLQAKGEA